MFYFTCNHLLSSTYVQHAKTFEKSFSVLFYFTCNHVQNIFANVLQMFYAG